MTRNGGPRVVASATLGLIVLLALGTSWAAQVFAVLALCLPPLLLLLGEPRRGRPHRLLAAVVSTELLLGGGFVAIAALSDGQAASAPAIPLLIQVLVMTLAPLVVVGVLYARDFERFSPRPEDLDRLRALDADRG